MHKRILGGFRDVLLIVSNHVDQQGNGLTRARQRQRENCIGFDLHVRGAQQVAQPRQRFFATVLSNTGNLAAVMKTMGHRDVKTAMKYQHPELAIVRAALNQASPVIERRA